MIVRNELWNDARVKKEATSLRAAGWRVCIIAREEPDRPPREYWQGILVLRPRFRSRVTTALRTGFDSGQRAGRMTKLVGWLRRNPVRRFFADRWRNAAYDFKLISAAISAHADVIHANDLDTLAVSWAAARLGGSRLVYDSHELWLGSARYLRETGAAGRLRDRLTERLLIGAADAVIAVTRGRGEVMKTMYPRIRGPWIVENCPHPTDETAPTGLLRSRLGIGPDTVLVLYQGIIAWERGIEQLLDAAPLLRGTGVRIAIVGHDVTGGTLPARAASPELGGLVDILPPVPSEKLPELTADADAGLILFRNTCLNHYYSLPNKLYEYMMAGVPIIASDLPEIARVIREYDIGRLVDPEDPASIAAAIRGIAADRRALAESGRRARQAALAHHTWAVQESVLLDIYSKLTRTRRRAH